MDFAQGVLTVTRRDYRGNVGDTRSEEWRRDLSLGVVLESLRAHVAEKGLNDPVFTHDGEIIVDNTLLANYLTPRMKRLGIKFPGFGWHTFRRLHLSLTNRGGLTVFDLRRKAGHADVRTTQHYIVDDMAQRTAATNGLTEAPDCE